MPTSATGSNRSDSGSTPVRRSAEHGFTPVRRSAEHGFTPVRRSAEHSFTPLRRSAEHGFTLVELMVVLVILGLMSAAVILAIPDPQGRVHDEAERFAARALAVRDDAIIEGRAKAIRIDAGGYRVEERARGSWQPATGRATRPVEWAQGTGVNAPSGRIGFDPVGSVAEPVTVELSRSGATARVVFPADGAVHVAR